MLSIDLYLIKIVILKIYKNFQLKLFILLLLQLYK